MAPLVPRVEPLARAADLLGAHRSADRIRRMRGEDFVSLEVPAGDGGRPVRVRMHRHHGDDQVARQLDEGGLWGFEPPLPPLFVELAKRSSGDVVDVGANTGLYSLLAVAANQGLHVHAVEALPAVADLLVGNLALNRPLTRRVRVHRIALSDASAHTTLYVPPPSGTTIETSASLDPTFKEEIGSTVEVETQTLDDLWDATGRPPVGITKVDTEGTEHLVLRGGERMLAATRSVVVCEVLPRASMDEMTQRLARIDCLDVRLRADALVVGTVVRFDPEAWNHAFVPREKVPVLDAAARAIGLELHDG